MVCLALSQVEHPNGRYQRESVQRAIDWIFSMQCKNGGWASFDKNNDRMVFQYVPFADHNAMLDPATVDITGRILEMLATYGYDKNHPAVKKAIEVHPRRAGAGRIMVWPLGRELHLRHHAGAARPGSDGRGPPRALCAAGCGVAAHGAEPGRRLGRDLRFLRRSQHQGHGPSTPSQTAWAIMGLLAANDTRSDCVARGIAYLLRTQKKDGSWDEPHLHRNRLPARVLSDVSHVPPVFPADRADDVFEGDGGEKQQLGISTQHSAFSRARALLVSRKPANGRG